MSKRSERGSQLKVQYSSFGPKGSFPGASRAEIYINWRKESKPRADASVWAFAEATRTVFLAQQRSLDSITDAETLCRFERSTASPSTVAARQRVLRYLTPNPNSAEGVLWQEARGGAVAVLEYQLDLERVGNVM